MADKKQKLEVAPPAEEPEEMPLPSDPKVIFLGGLFALALLAAVYVAAEIVLPLVLAVVLKLLLQPAMRLLERWHVPRMLAALLLILSSIRNNRRPGRGHSGPGQHLGGKASRGHSSASGAVELLAGTHQHAPTVFATGGGLWTTSRGTRRGLGGKLKAYDAAFHRHSGFC